MTPRRTILAVLTVAFGACRSASGQLGNESASVVVSVASIDFGPAYLGAKPQQLLSVSNNGGAPDTVTVAAISGGVFAAGSGSFDLAGGASEGVSISFVPTVAGPAQATLHVSWSGGSADVALEGLGVAWPVCDPQGLCGAAAFDPDTGVCSHTTQPDGTACSDSSGCLTGASCLGGQCLGTVASCDDGNACTVDSCVLGQGCQHTPVVCAGSADPCQANSCDPTRGCVTNELADGTPCASTESCQSATVCLGGTCTGTPVPDGTPCTLAWEPCFGDAVCKGGGCDSPSADKLQPGDLLWTTPSSLGAQGGLTVDPDGGVYFVASGSDAASGHVVGLDRCGNSRWTSSVSVDADVMLDGDQLVAFDPAAPRLIGLDVVTGAIGWQLALAPALSSMCAASDFGSGGQGGASLSFPVMSSQGQIFVAGSCTSASGKSGDSTSFLLAVFRYGVVDWLVPAPYADAAPALDASGNIYLVTREQGGGQTLSSFDPSGASRFAAVSYGGQSDVQLVVGSSQIVDIANGNAFGFDGSKAFALKDGAFSSAFFSSLQARGGAVDGAGNVYFPFAGSGSPLQWGAVSPSGSLLWSLAFTSDNDVASFPVLSAEGTLIAVEAESQNGGWQTSSPGTIVAIDTSSGKQLWSKSTAGAGSLAIGTGGALLLAGSSVQSVYAGQVHGSATAPWSRYRGDNSNRGAAVGP